MGCLGRVLGVFWGVLGALSGGLYWGEWGTMGGDEFWGAANPKGREGVPGGAEGLRWGGGVFWGGPVRAEGACPTRGGVAKGVARRSSAGTGRCADQSDGRVG